MKLSDLIVIILFSILWLMLVYTKQNIQDRLLEIGSLQMWTIAPIVIFIILILITRFFKNRYL